MPTHDIIDNRSEKLVDNINRILGSTDSARFAVGYFFLSGLESIAKSLAHVKELRLLIGNTTNRETLEQLAEGYRRLDIVSERAEEEAYPKKTEIKRMAEETANNIRATVELMDQSDDAEALLKIMVRLIEEKRLKVKVYTKGRFHAKAYIFDYADMFDVLGNKVERHENGIAIIGSSNLTLAGVSHNTELNVCVQGNNNHAELGRWFDELWNESQDFDEALMREMQQSWAVAPLTPYDIYMKTLYALVKDRLEDEDDRDILWDDDITRKLADFQKVAVRQAVQITRDFGGSFVADVVGLGKSYIGAAIVKHFERTDHARPLIICPAPLVEMWEQYNDAYQLNARVLSTGYLYEGDNGKGNILLQDAKYRDRDFVLVDESHNFRYSDTQRYKILQAFLATGGRKACFLTATPRNKSAWDVYFQIKLFHQDDKTDLPVDPADLKQYFKLIESGGRRLPDLLAHILIRRTRNHILRWYGYDSVTHQPVDPSRFREYMDGEKRAYVLVAGKHQFFPRRELDTIEYSIEDTYLRQFPEFLEFHSPKRTPTDAEPPESPESITETPEELLASGSLKLRRQAEQELLARVKACPAEFFERLVVKLLTTIGYGGSLADAGKAIGKAGDGGIDGVIKEDKLGLDLLYIQAKKWDDTTVGRPEIQKFVGALHGKRARKGIFITTSTFSKDATEYAEGVETKVILIDGARLTELMFDYGVGVSTVNSYVVKRIDSDFFEDESLPEAASETAGK